MKKLTRFEEVWLESILKDKKRQVEEYLKKHNDSFETYIIKNETLPMIEALLSKFKN